LCARPLRRRRRPCCTPALFGTRLHFLLQTLHLLLELLIAVLELLNVAGELPDHRLEPIDPRQQVSVSLLCADGPRAKRHREKEHEQKGGTDHCR
jgi:hypothetical protein